MGTFVWLRILGWGFAGLALLVVGRVLWKKGKAVRFFRGGCLVRLAALVVLASGLFVAGSKIAGILRAQRAERGLRESVAEYGAPSRVVERYVATHLALTESPLFVDYRKRHAPLDKSPAEPEAQVLATLAELGTARLDAASLQRSAELRQQLAQLSPEACRGLWSNQLEPAERLRALNVLSDAELDGWFALEARAVKLELAGTVPGQSVSRERIERAVDVLAARLPADQAGWFRQAYRNGTAGDAESGCLALRTIADHRGELGNADYTVLTRYLAAPNSVVDQPRSRR